MNVKKNVRAYLDTIMVFVKSLRVGYDFLLIMVAMLYKEVYGCKRIITFFFVMEGSLLHFKVVHCQQKINTITGSVLHLITHSLVFTIHIS